MIRRPEKELYAWMPAADIGTMPPPAPFSRITGEVWHPHFAELLTEWLSRIGMPKARYGRLAPPGTVRVGILKCQRTVVRCEGRDPEEFLAVYLVLAADADAVIAASRFSSIPSRRPATTSWFSPNGTAGHVHS